MLDEVLDKRLVRTLLHCLVAIMRLRNNPQALWRERTRGLPARRAGQGLQCPRRHQASGETAAISQMDGGTD
jgi:hypothetical protein